MMRPVSVMAEAFLRASYPPRRAGRPQLTPWFPGTVFPARAGLYQRRFPNGKGPLYWAHWDGENWRNGSINKTVALNSQFFDYQSPNDWRGRAAP